MTLDGCGTRVHVVERASDIAIDSSSASSSARAGSTGADEPENPFVHDRLPLWLLRAGLAFVFMYAAVAMLLTPAAFMSYVPAVLRESLLARPFLLAIAIVELLLTVALLWRPFTHVAALVSAAMMIAIISCNFDSFDVLFRNVGIACAALSLALQTRTVQPGRSRT